MNAKTSRIVGVGLVTRGKHLISVTLTEEMTRRVGGHTMALVDGRVLYESWLYIERAIKDALPGAAEVEVYAARRYNSCLLKIVRS